MTDIAHMKVAIVLVHEPEVFLDPLELNYFIAIADQLVQGGGKVTFITLNLRNLKGAGESNAAHLAMSQIRDAGHRIHCPVTPEFMPNIASNGQASEAAYLAYEALKVEQYDVVHFQDRLAPAYYCLLAREQGLFSRPSVMTIHVNQPTIYRLMTGRDVERDYSIPAKCFMERCCIEQADVVYLQSESVCRQLQAFNYAVQSDRHVRPPAAPLPISGKVAEQRQTVEKVSVTELLYVSPLNQAEGYTTFIYALDVLARRKVPLKRVTLAGMEDESFEFMRLLDKHRENWPFEVHVLSSISLNLLRLKIDAVETLTCMPSPYGVRSEFALTALLHGRPFLATEAADIRVQLSGPAYDDYFVGDHHLDWANRLEQVLTEGFRLADGPAITEWHDWWLGQHASLAEQLQVVAGQYPAYAGVQSLSDAMHQGPMVSVCIAHFNRPDSIVDVFESLQQQTFTDFEMVIVDDGSEDHHQQTLQEYVEKIPNACLVTQENRYLGAVRNTGARHSTGKYLLFMDDDNYAMEQEIEVFVRVAEYTGADILCCFSDLFEGDDKPAADNIRQIRRMPFGPDLYYGLLRNGFGDSNCLVRRSTWEKLGGFTEHYRIGLDDHEFFARAVLSGCKLQVIPEALFYYRLNAAPMKASHANRHADFLRVLQPYLDNGMLDPDLLPLLFTIRAGYNLR